MPVITNVKYKGCKPTMQGVVSRLRFLAYVKKHKNKPLPGTKACSNLYNFCSPRQRAFNLEYAKRVESIRPTWFRPTTEEKRNAIMKMALNGEPKPSQLFHPLGITLRSYTYPCCKCYNHEWITKLRKLRPDWFIPEKWIMRRKKLIRMAKNGYARPSMDTDLGRYLYRFTHKSTCFKRNKISRCWSEDFNVEIRNLRPDWFVNPLFERAEAKRIEVLKYAKRHATKPRYGSSMGTFLSRCLTTNAHTAQNKRFRKALALIRPDWV